MNQLQTVIVGIDFGTSATKIAFKQEDGLNRIIPIMHNDGTPSSTFVFPSEVAWDGHSLKVGWHARNIDQAHLRLRFLKVVVAGEVDADFSLPDVCSAFEETREISKCPVSAEVLMAVFLAHAARLARLTVAKYFGQPRHCLFNVCVPVDHIEQSDLRERFQKVIAAAELVEKSMPEGRLIFPDRKVLFQAADLYKAAEYSPLDQGHIEREDSTATFFAIPESVAELEGYLSSEYREPGIAVIVDIGAGTTDVSVLCIRDAVDGHLGRWYVARNHPIGLASLDQHIGQCVVDSPCCVTNKFPKCYHCALIDRPIVKDVIRGLGNIHARTTETWCKGFERHHQIVQAVHRSALHDFHPDRLQLFLVGGGSELAMCKRVFHKSPLGNIEGTYRSATIRAPRGYQNSAQAPYRRMAVAAGLTTIADSLCRYQLPSDVIAPDIPQMGGPIFENPQTVD